MYECPHLRLKINKIQFVDRKPCLGTNWKGEGARGSKQKQQHVVQEVCKARAEAGRMVHLIRGGSRGIWTLSRLIIRWAQDDWSHAITARYYLNYSLKKLHVLELHLLSRFGPANIWVCLGFSNQVSNLCGFQKQRVVASIWSLAHFTFSSPPTIPNQGCQMANFAAQHSGAIVQKPEGPNTYDLKIHAIAIWQPCPQPSSSL